MFDPRTVGPSVASLEENSVSKFIAAPLRALMQTGRVFAPTPSLKIEAFAPTHALIFKGANNNIHT
jgi:hypothetical protein